MFDIGFPELLLVAVIGLLVLGPERLPSALRTLGLMIGRMRRQFTKLRDELEHELGADEIRQQLYNESIMADAEAIQRELSAAAGQVKSTLDQSADLAKAPPTAAAASKSAAPGVTTEPATTTPPTTAAPTGESPTPPAKPDPLP